MPRAVIHLPSGYMGVSFAGISKTRLENVMYSGFAITKTWCRSASTLYNLPFCSSVNFCRVCISSSIKNLYNMLFEF